ncbi:MAG TPA: Ig-like domain-containing protein, partial [Gemmatimonadaceae bacterium]
ENGDGAVGDGTTDLRTSPLQVGVGRKWIAVGTGHGTSCGLDTAGAIHCWGAGLSGELGDGGSVGSLAFVPIVSAERFQDVGVGWAFACGLTLGGDIHCWGRDHGSASFPQTPTLPHSISGSLRFTRMALGISVVCGVDMNGDVWCSGNGSAGQLGNGTRGRSATFVHAALPSPAVDIVVGGLHTCALLANSEMHCWGINALGAGVQESLRPLRVNFGGGPPGPAVRLEAYGTTTLDSVSAGSLVEGDHRVRAVDATGLVVPNVTVTFTPSAGSSASPGTMVTNAEGLAGNFLWRASVTPGLNSLTASIPGASPVVFTARGLVPGPPATMSCSPFFACAQAGPVNGFTNVPSVGARVRDAAGLVVAGVSVTITSNGTGNRTIPPLPVTLLTDVDGVAGITSWRLDSLVRTDTIIFTAAGLAGSPDTAIATGFPLAPARLSTMFPAASLAGLAITPAPTVEVQDIYGNRVTTTSNLVTLSLSDTPSNGVFGGTIAVPAVSGVATFGDLVPNVAGSYTVNAFAAGLAGASTNFLATGISVFPDFVNLVPGGQQQLIPSFIGVAAGAVTWSSTNASVASVDNTGLVTAISQGTTTITATYVSDPRATFDVAVTVGPPVAPTITIQSITQSGTGLPVALNNVSGSIDVSLGLQANGNMITGTSLFLDSVQVVTQAGAATLLTLNTAATHPGGALVHCNGPHQLDARVFYTGGPPGGVVSNSLALTFNNPGSC